MVTLDYCHLALHRCAGRWLRKGSWMGNDELRVTDRLTDSYKYMSTDRDKWMTRCIKAWKEKGKKRERKNQTLYVIARTHLFHEHHTHTYIKFIQINKQTADVIAKW